MLNPDYHGFQKVDLTQSSFGVAGSGDNNLQKIYFAYDTIKSLYDRLARLDFQHKSIEVVLTVLSIELGVICPPAGAAFALFVDMPIGWYLENIYNE